MLSKRIGYWKGIQKEKAPHYGKHHTKESRRKIREARAKQIITPQHRQEISKSLLNAYSSGKRVPYWKGKRQSQESVEKRRLSNIGKHHIKHNIESINKMHLAKIGKVSKNKGKTFEERYGFEKAKQLKQKQSIKTKEWLKNHKPPMLGKKHSQETKKIIREKRIYQEFPSQNSSIEKKLQNQLTQAGISWIPNYTIKGQPDLFIPLYNTLVFADGCWFHACHECKLTENIYTPQAMKAKKTWHRDFRIKFELELEGYKVVRLWEHDINKEGFNILKYIGNK